MTKFTHKMDKSEYKKIQRELLSKLVIPSIEQDFILNEGEVIFTFDIQYQNQTAYVAVDVQRWKGENLGVFLKQYPVEEEYQSGYFAFREGPILEKSFQEIVRTTSFRPKLLIIDGHGTAHPRKLGVATWMGIKCKIPSIGVAKRTLLSYEGELGETAESKLAVCLDDEIVGYVLRTQDGIKPVFVSSGTGLSQEKSLEIISQLRGEYRIIAPIRRADHAAREFARKNIS